MSPDLINQAITIFDSFDKWNAFIELSNARESIKVKYFEKLKQELINKFNRNDFRKDWAFKIITHNLYRWYLKDYGPDSICIVWRQDDTVLWSNIISVDVQMAINLLNTPDFNSIFNCFDNTDTFSNTFPHHYCEEKHRYEFNDSTSYSGITEQNFDKLSWFAGNKTDEMINQISMKINRFRTPEITALLMELNRRCKKS